VWIDELAVSPEPDRVYVLRVSFEPAARTAWHTHPHGQTLHILSGVARLQREGEPIMEAYPGDTVWFEPNERHWHGAAEGRTMVHLALQRTDAQATSAYWQEHVTDETYASFRK
jgi:quercetin dioxygenase-like cupin family protein